MSADNTKVLNGYTYWKNGVKCTGNMASFSPGTHAPESGMNGQGFTIIFLMGTINQMDIMPGTTARLLKWQMLLD